MEDNYIPYGPEWENEMMKLPKKMLIAMFKANQTKLHIAEKYIEFAPLDPDVMERARQAAMLLLLDTNNR